MLRIILMEDDKQVIETMTSICSHWSQEPIEFVSYEQSLTGTLLLANVTLHHQNQVNYIKKIKNNHPHMKIIFYSNNIEDALTTYEVDHEYFFMLQDAKNGLPKALERALK